MRWIWIFLLNDENLYLKSEDEIFSHFEKVAKTAASLDIVISQTDYILDDIRIVEVQ